MILKQLIFVIALTVGLLRPQVLPGPSRAQSEPPSFEVASIRPSGPHSVRGSEGGPGPRDPGRYVYNKASLQDLIQVAWNIRPFQIVSPAALDRQSFDVAVKVPDGTTKQLFRVMLQNLLGDRFGLKMHMESRLFPAYELAVAKSGFKLKEAIQGQKEPGIMNQASIVGGYEVVRLTAEFEPLSALARYLSTPDQLPVVDKTGLTGSYSFTLEYARDISPNAPDGLPAAPALFTALEKQLGLRLVSKRSPFDVVVVESFNKMPTEN